MHSSGRRWQRSVREDAELREKLHHLHLVQWAYLHIWRAEAIKPRELGAFATSAAIQAWAREYYRELLSYLLTVRDGDLRRDVRFPWADHLVQRFGRAEPDDLGRERPADRHALELSPRSGGEATPRAGWGASS